MRRNIFVALFLLIGSGATTGFPHAQTAMRTTPERHRETAEEIEKRTAEAGAEKAAIEGAATVALLDQADLALPSGFVYVPALQAARLLRAHARGVDAQGTANQNKTYPNLVGIVGLTDPDQNNGLVLIRYVGVGHIDDTRAATWDADKLLAQIRAKAATLKHRRGAPKLDVLGWVEAPAYDANRHHLVSSLLTRMPHQAEGAELRLDYDAYALGRDGYFHLKLLTPPSLLAAQRPMFDRLLEALRYRPGKSYEDFDSATDRPAPYGLSSLVGSGLLQELGLTDRLFGYLVTFGLPLYLLIVLGDRVARWFRRWTKPATGAAPP